MERLHTSRHLDLSLFICRLPFLGELVPGLPSFSILSVPPTVWHSASVVSPLPVRVRLLRS